MTLNNRDRQWLCQSNISELTVNIEFIFKAYGNKVFFLLKIDFLSTGTSR
jgi:hypothetical protein